MQIVSLTDKPEDCWGLLKHSLNNSLNRAQLVLGQQHSEVGLNFIIIIHL